MTGSFVKGLADALSRRPQKGRLGRAAGRQGWPVDVPRRVVASHCLAKPAQVAPMGPYRQPQHLLRLLERVLKVLGWLTTPDRQVGQHRLQVRWSECPRRPDQVGAPDNASAPDHLNLQPVLPYLPVRGGQPPQHLQDALQEAKKVPRLSIGTHRSNLGRLGPGSDSSRRARGPRRAQPWRPAARPRRSFFGPLDRAWAWPLKQAYSKGYTST